MHFFIMQENAATKRLLLEEKLSGLSRLMRCSRVGGVILYSFDNGHFMAYTSPPPAVGASPQGEAFWRVHFPAITNRCAKAPQLLNAPPWHADRRSAQGVRSTTEGEIFKGTDGACADPDTRIFPATGAYSPTPPSSLIQSTFTSQRSLL